MRYLFLTWTLLFSVLLVAQEKEASKTAEHYLNEGATFYRNQEYIKALNLSKKALNISLGAGDEYHLALSYNLIGTIYNEFSQTNRAVKYYTKGLAYANKLENDTLRLWLNTNLGNVYYYKGTEVEKSISYYTKSLKLAEKLDDSLQIAFIRLNIANSYFEIDKMDSGMSFITPVGSFIEQSGNVESKITYYDLLGKYNSLKLKNDEAEAFFFKAIDLANKAKLPSQLEVLYSHITQHYVQMHDSANAAKYQNLLNQFKKDDQLVQELDTVEQMATQIELDEYKFQFEQIELKNELQNQKIKASRIAIVSVSIIIVVLLILLYSLYRNNIMRKRNNAILHKANAELLEAKNVAEENSKLKSQFIATVSHELRTPLYGVIGLTDIILEENKNNVNQENLSSLQFSAQYLLALVNDLLEINKAEEKKIVLNITPFNIREQLEIINKSLAFIAESNGNDLQIQVDKKVPSIILGDQLRLSQILMNLLSNGLKFTEKGTVKIEVNLISQDKHSCKLEFKISDTGIGIKLEDQEKIFDKFVQLERKKGDYQGTGLGLSIVKKLVELFGGAITVKSEENKGTLFFFTLPFNYLRDVEKANETHIDFVSTSKTLHFLVVEDNKINQIVTKKIIEQHNYLCTVVSSGYEALSELQVHSFDVILMDINMPLIDGYETSKRIRDCGITTPIIALTAFDRVEVEQYALDAGITDILIKPFKPQLLFEIVKRLL